MKCINSFCIKCLVVLAVVLNIVSSLNNSAYAQDNEFEIGNSVVPFNRLSENEINILFDENNYDESMNGKCLMNVPIIKVYIEICWNMANRQLNDIVSESEKICAEQNFCEYIVLDRNPFKIRVMQDAGEKYTIGICKAYTEQVPTYISDIGSFLKNISYSKDGAALGDIYCF